jgi:two-component system OmpR family response regulator
MRVLLVEDDPMIGKGLSQALGDAGMSVDWVRDGEAGLEAMVVGGHTIILLDLGLPKVDGMALLQSAREAGVRTPVLVITARDALSSRIAGLDHGADDYIVKPFDADELMARMRAVLRRNSGHTQSTLQAGGIELDTANHHVTYKGTTEMLPAREFALLMALADRPGMILSKSQLEERLYGWGEEVESNAVEVLIHYVRKKFGKDIIRNVRGVGWLVAKEG